MAYFSKVVDDKVVDCIQCESNWFDAFDDTSPGRWIETFVAGGSRVHFGSIGMNWDGNGDYFYPDQPYPSWTLNDTTKTWEAPVAIPADGGDGVTWNEEDQAWDAVE
jgi:hypothetical protein